MFIVRSLFWDPKKGRTGSTGFSGGFLRTTPHIVPLSAAIATRCGMRQGKAGVSAALFPDKTACQASGNCLIWKKSDHADGVMR